MTFCCYVINIFRESNEKSLLLIEIHFTANIKIEIHFFFKVMGFSMVVSILVIGLVCTFYTAIVSMITISCTSITIIIFMTLKV